ELLVACKGEPRIYSVYRKCDSVTEGMVARTDKQRFIIGASASRVETDLLAVPQWLSAWLTLVCRSASFILNEAEKTRDLTCQPYDPTVKENRIFGLRPWFSNRDVREGDLISTILEDQEKKVYRIQLDRNVQQRQEQQTRERLYAAETDSEAER